MSQDIGDRSEPPMLSYVEGALVLTALSVDRRTSSEVASRYGAHRSWVYRLKAVYEAEGNAALTPRYARTADLAATRDSSVDGRLCPQSAHSPFSVCVESSFCVSVCRGTDQ